VSVYVLDQHVIELAHDHR